jgi:signal transduction histidine kinase
MIINLPGRDSGPENEPREPAEPGSAARPTALPHAENPLSQSENDALPRELLRALAARMEKVREEERKKVARDLHDQIGQLLTALKIDLVWIARRLPEGESGVRERIARSIELIHSGAQSVRNICSGLRPGILDDLGLAAAIEWQSGEFAARTGIGCEAAVPAGPLRLDGESESALFRIFQEALTNIARHAEATSVRVSLLEEPEELVLRVEDNGKGFREEEGKSSLGLLGMKERAQACGGQVRIASAPGSGTSVTVRLPLPAIRTGERP